MKIKDILFKAENKVKGLLNTDIKDTFNIFFVFMLCGVLVNAAFSQRIMERLGRGIVAVNRGNGNVYISWRLLGTDPDEITFNMYRSTDDGAPVKLNSEPIVTTTDFSDKNVDLTKSNSWFVKPVIDGVEQLASKSFTLAANAPVKNFIAIPLKTLAGYSTLHVYVGDLDGDGEYDYIVKRFPEDNTKNIYLEAYMNDGTYKWRIDLGPNMEQGNYSANPFVLVYDFDCDGKAEVFTRSGEGTRFADGTTIGDVNKDGKTDYRTFPATSIGGYILLGDNCPEYISMVDGMTGKELARTDYIARGAKADWESLWGDGYGHRMNFNFVGVAYFDGIHPSIIASRGEGSKMDIAAWDYGNKAFTKKWTWSSRGKTFSNGQHWADFHNIRVVDLDGDGKDEVSWGVNAMDDNGSPLYLAPADLGHGDRFVIADIDPDRVGLECFVIQQYNTTLAALFDARTGARIKSWTTTQTDVDVGRGDVADIDPLHKGKELFSFASAGVQSCKGAEISSTIPHPALSIWWDGDVLREFLDAADGNGYNPIINKWNYTSGTSGRLLSLYNEGGQYSTKTTYAGRPPLYGDIMGDWREEIVCENGDRTELRIFSTWTPASRRIYTLMHDPAYRACINPKYYLPTTETDFYIGDGMSTPPRQNITFPDSKYYTLTTSVTGEGKISPDKGTYEANRDIQLTATSATKYLFDHWEGDATGNDNPLTVTMDADKTIKAVFISDTSRYYTVNAKATPGGTLVQIPSSGEAAQGTKITFSPVPDCGWKFNGWTGYYTGTDSVYTIEAIDTSITLTAHFMPLDEQVYEAECGIVTSGIVESINTGFSGAGYINVDNVIGSSLGLPVYAKAGGEQSLSITYSNGTASPRYFSVSVNGTVVMDSLSFESTTDWTTWKVKQITLSLEMGINEIVFNSITADGGPNVDKLVLNIKVSLRPQELAAPFTIYNSGSFIFNNYNPGAKVRIELFMINGRKSFDRKVVLGSSITSVKLPLCEMNKGFYILKTSINGVSSTRKLNVMK